MKTIIEQTSNEQVRAETWPALHRVNEMIRKTLVDGRPLPGWLRTQQSALMQVLHKHPHRREGGPVEVS